VRCPVGIKTTCVFTQPRPQAAAQRKAIFSANNANPGLAQLHPEISVAESICVGSRIKIRA